MKKKCTILAVDKGYDGVSREIVNLANALVDLYDIQIFFLRESNKHIQINPKIKVIIKDVNILDSRKVFRELFKDSSVVLVTSSELSKYVFKYRHSKCILWEHKETKLSDQKYLSKYDLIVVPNILLKNYYFKYNENTLIINDAIELPCEKVIRTGKNIVYIGKLNKDKNLEVLFQMFKKILCCTSSSLIIIGDGDYRVHYENIVKNEKIKNVFFKGLLTKEEVQSELLDAALYVNFNESDSTNLSMLEAMSYGVPIVSFDTEEGMHSFIVDEINGYLIKEKDFSKFYEKIKSLLLDEELLENFSLCAKEKSLEFDIYSLKVEWLKIL